MKKRKLMFGRAAAAVCGVLAACQGLAASVFAEEEAAATTAAEQSGSLAANLLVQLAPLLILIVVLYFLMLRPQQKREKEAQNMRDNVRIGDEICTAGGIVGIVIKVNDDTVVMETGGERNKIRIKKWAIHENLTQLEEKQAEERAKKNARQNGIAVAGAEPDAKKSKKKSD